MWLSVEDGQLDQYRSLQNARDKKDRTKNDFDREREEKVNESRSGRDVCYTRVTSVGGGAHKIPEHRISTRFGLLLWESATS